MNQVDQDLEVLKIHVSGSTFQALYDKLRHLHHVAECDTQFQARVSLSAYEIMFLNAALGVALGVIEKDVQDENDPGENPPPVTPHNPSMN